MVGMILLFFFFGLESFDAKIQYNETIPISVIIVIASKCSVQANHIMSVFGQTKPSIAVAK